MTAGAFFEARDTGIYCIPANAYIDPQTGVKRAIVTHAHGDHARSGSDVVYTTPETALLARRRLGRWAVVKQKPQGEQFELGEALVSLHPAGHMLGSAQVRVEAYGKVAVLSGDYKRGPDPSCRPFEVLPCDLFVTESTFGSPEFVWPDIREVISEVAAWSRKVLEAGESPVLVCYSSGKAQRVLSLLADAGMDNVAVSRDIENYCRLYEELQVSLPRVQPLSRSRKPRLAMVSPGVSSSRKMRSLRPFRLAFLSGWALVQDTGQGPDTSRYHARFAVSDHADWPSLLRTCREVGAGHVATMHGEGAMLRKALVEAGVGASRLSE